MPLINIVLVLIVTGVVLFLINTYIPMQAMVLKLLNAVVIIALIIWLLRVFGVIGYLYSLKV